MGSIDDNDDRACRLGERSSPWASFEEAGGTRTIATLCFASTGRVTDSADRDIRSKCWLRPDISARTKDGEHKPDTVAHVEGLAQKEECYHRIRNHSDCAERSNCGRRSQPKCSEVTDLAWWG